MNKKEISKNHDLIIGMNKEQQEAVTHTSGPLLIIAGAGTGKTNVITKRIAWLISQKFAKPEEILALTFTDKAAGEMEDRVLEIVPYGMVDIWISTFHSFGDRIIKENAISLGITPDYQVFSKPEEILFFKDNIFKLSLKHYLPLGNPSKHIEAILDFFSRIKDEDISEEEFSKYANEKKDEKLIELSNAYINFKRIMKEEGKIDFGDQIGLCLELFRKNPDILSDYQNKFKYILVDEFQDTNFSQYKLIKLLAGPNQNITVVADDDQSIYRFRGAAISNVLDFQNDFPQAKLTILTQNYRSTKEILASSYKLIQHNNPDRLEFKEKINKKLSATRSGKPPEVITCETDSAEADKIAEIIKNKVAEGKYQYKDFAILVRANSQATQFMNTLDYEQVPYHFTGRSGLYNLSEIRLIINFLRSITDDNDSLSLYHLATSEIYNISNNDIIPILSYSKKTNIPLKEILIKILDKKLFNNIDKNTFEKLNHLNESINKYRDQITDCTVGQLVYSFLNESSYLKKLLKIESPESEMKIINISHFFERIIRKFELSSRDDKTAIKFIQNLDLLMEAGENPATAQMNIEDDVVKIITVHASKGLEFPIVFMVSLTSDRFPSKSRSEAIPLPNDLIHETLPGGNFHLQEERRLFYVGVTRAKNELYLSWAKKYHDNIREKKPSQFILEALDEVNTSNIIPNKKASELLKKYIKQEIPARALNKFHQGAIIHLNPHQIDDYLTCPLKFKYIHILEIPIVASHQVTYGNAIHKTIEFFLLEKMKNNIPTIEQIYKAFENFWVNEGFITREHEERRMAEGKASLKSFYESEITNKKIPHAVEKSFYFNFSADVIIKGRFDTVYKDENQIEIKDFKTSNVADKEKAISNASKNRPFAIYSLAIETLENVQPKLTMHFINNSIEVSICKSEKDIAKLKIEIQKVIDGIKEKNFEAKPIYQACSFCPYKDICPNAQ